MMRTLIAAVLLVLAAAFIAAAGDAAMEIPVKKQKYFNSFDADGDAALNEAEFMAMVKKQFENKGKDGYEAVAKKRFAKKDANGDGKVDIQEFVTDPWKKK